MQVKGSYLIGILTLLIIISGCTTTPAPGTTDSNNPIGDGNRPVTDGNNPVTDGNNPTGTIGLRRLPTIPIGDVNGPEDNNGPTDGNGPVDGNGPADNNGPAATQAPVGCDVKENERERDICYKKKALETNQLSECDKIVTTSIKDGCYSGIGLAGNNTEACLKIATENTTLRDSCVKKAAIANKTSEHCTELSTSADKDECYLKISQANSNKELCTYIADETIKDQCDPSVKQRLQEFEACKAMTVGPAKIQCITDSAFENKTMEWCNELSEDRNALNWCQKTFVAVLDGNTSETTCNQLAYVQTRNDCYYKIATLKPDKALCPNITDGNTIDTCYYVISETVNDPELCKSIRFTNKEVYTGCIQRVAPAAGDTSLCELLDKPNEYLTCYESISKEKGWEKCNEMQKDHFSANGYAYEGLCIKTVAIAANNLALCDNIISTPVRSACKAKNASFK